MSTQHPASYRDPAGYIFTQDGVLYRAVQSAYAPAYEHLMGSGLYASLMSKKLMIPHEEVSLAADAWKVLKPQRLDTWSYPYEWCFGQLKDAALATLELALAGLGHGMILKDATAYNIQFVQGKAALIDTLSFALYEEGQPWQAFRQFCDHFLNPLLAMQALPGLSPAVLMAYPDGLPTALTARLLPWKKRLSFNHQLYVYLAASTAGKSSEGRSIRIPKAKIIQNLAQLKSFISSLELAPVKSVWNHYYEETILSRAYLDYKTTAVRSLLQELKPQRVTDVGCNTGAFSLLAAEVAEEVIALDFDALSIEQLYAQRKPNIYPMVADIAYPTPALGWANAERQPLTARIGADAVLALALVHHLALTANVPLPFISRMFAEITRRWLIIEFVPKKDPRAQQLLAGKGDIFPHYTQADFELVFEVDFHIARRLPMEGSGRMLYLMEKKG